MGSGNGSALLIKHFAQYYEKAQPMTDQRVTVDMMNKQRDYSLFDDSELVRRARNDSGAFGELYQRYVNKIYSYVYYRTGNAHDAEDLTARVFHRALVHIETYVERGLPFSAWLYRIAHNLVANWHRDRSRRKVIPLDEFVAAGLKSEAPEGMAEQQEEHDALLASIRRLPEERQQLLILKFVDKLSNAEIGAIMDRSEGAINDAFGNRLLATRHQHVDKFGDVLIAEFRIRKNVALGNLSASWHFMTSISNVQLLVSNAAIGVFMRLQPNSTLGDYRQGCYAALGFFAPYLERLCLRSFTP